MGMNKRIARSPTSASDPAVGAVVINYGSGDQVLSEHARGIYITTAGALAVVFFDGSTATLSGLLAGTVYPFAVKQITQTGSTAAGYVLL